MNNVQEVIDKLEANDFCIRDLELYLESSIVLIKVNAIVVVLRQKITEQSIINRLNCISQNIYQEPKVIGEWNTGHYALAVLYLLNTIDTLEVYNGNMRKLDADTQQGVKALSEQLLCMLKIN